MDLRPFEIESPAVVRFSGGRTSAYMLRRILDAHGGALPADVHVVFSNTGRERPETLDFVRDCGERWGVPIRWLEWRLAALPRVGVGAGPGWWETIAEVDHESASRKGEPFDALIRWKGVLPNPVMRLCTQHLKIEAMRLFARDHLGLDAWDSIVGIRADEPRRHGIIGPDKRNPRETVVCPLVDAHVCEAEVLDYWRRSPFDLRLLGHEGNCDLCFLKPLPTLDRILRDRPDLADWWIGWERAGVAKVAAGNMFHDKRPTFATMLERTRVLPMLPGLDLDYDARPCACTD